MPWIEVTQLQADSLRSLGQQAQAAQERLNTFVSAILAGIDVENGQNVRLEGRKLIYDVPTVSLDA
jgi:hypothetical protein